MQDAYLGNLPSDNEIDDLMSNLDSTKWHDGIVERAVNITKKIPGVKAIVLRGSLANKTGDAFSDIDFYILHDKSENESVLIRNGFMKKISNIGDVVHFFTSTYDLNSRIIFFKPFIKFELDVKTLKEARSWQPEKIKILYDPKGVMNHILLISDGEFKLDSVLEDIRNTAVAFPAFCYITAGHLVRGEWITALEDIQWVRSKLLQTSSWFLSQWDEGPRRAEQRFPRPIIDFYWSMQSTDVADIWNSISTAIGWYMDWLVPWFNEHSIKTAVEQIPLIRLLLGMLQKEFLKRTQ